MSKLISKLRSTSTIKETDLLGDSPILNKKDMVQTSVPAMNIALSGRLDGGLTPGLTVFAGPSKHFKTAFALLLAKSYLDKYEDAVVLLYDSEFGAPLSYFQSFGIDPERVVHSPITDIEMLKIDIVKQLHNIERGDKIFILIDSVGNLASRKEVEDALNEKTVADMSRAKAMKSLFRMVTPHLTIKDIPCVVVNHTYKEIGMYPKDIVSGGTGIYYSADNIFIVGRQQEKDKDGDVSGFNFVLNVEKSRFTREKSKIPVTVSFEGGISQWSGLLEMALESGHVIKPKVGWYQVVGGDGKNYREADTNTADFWLPILKNKEFREWVEKNYRISSNSILSEVSDDEIQEAYND